MTKQDMIEREIDRISQTSTGQDLVALIAIQARHVRNRWEPNQFIKEFAHSIGFRFNKPLLYIDLAVRIMKYLYPENPVFWDIWDEIYLKRIKNSAWFKHSGSKFETIKL
jgi:hypothetical protein